MGKEKFTDIEKSLFPEKLSSVYFKTQDVGKMLDISDQTVREMAQKFSEFIEPLLEKTEGGHRRFSEQAVNVLAYIKHLNKNEGMTYDAILAYLREKKPQETQLTPLELKSYEELRVVTEQNKVLLQGYIDLRHSMDLYQQVIEQQGMVIERQGVAIAELRKEVHELKEAGESNKEDIIRAIEERTEKLDQILSEWRQAHSEKKGFFSRLFGK